MNTEINQVIYMAIEADYSYRYFEDFDSAYNYSPQGYIAKIKHTDTHVSMKGYEHEILDVNFIDEHQNSKKIIKRGWKISSISRGYWSQREILYIDKMETQVDWAAINDCTFSDPKGELRGFSLSMYLSNRSEIFGPLKILKLLDILGKYDSWTDFDLNQKNKEISIKNRELKQLITKLGEKIEVLRDQLKEHNITPKF